MTSRLPFGVLACLVPLAVACQPQEPAESEAASELASDVTATVTDTYFDVSVEDPYRWLEDWSNPEVQDWSDQQTALTRACLDNLTVRDSLVTELTQLFEGSDQGSLFAPAYREGSIYAWRRKRGEQQATLVKSVYPGDLNEAKVILDLNVEDPSASTSFDWYVPSPSGRYVAIALSEGGSERARLRIIDTSDGSTIGADIPNVYNPTAGGDIAWRSDETGFVYTRYPLPGEQNEDRPNMFLKAYEHDLVSDGWADDRLVLGADFDMVAQIRFQLFEGGIAAWVQDGDSGNFAYYRRMDSSLEDGFVQNSTFDDGHFQFIEGDAGELFILTTDQAPSGKILRLASGASMSEAEEIIPTSPSGALSHSYYSHTSPTAVWHEGRLFIRYDIGGPSEIRVFDRDGDQVEVDSSFSITSISQMTTVPGGLLFSAEGYASPGRWFQLDNNLNSVVANDTFPQSQNTGWDDIEVSRIFATSNDGTQVPINIMFPPNFSPDNGPTTAFIMGYGGFRISLRPQFRSEYRALLDRGVLIAEVNLRGGAEFGEEWHQQGSLTNKQNVFDDFSSAIKHLQAAGWTTPEQTTIYGVSNGGLLIGASVVQFPELSGAAIAKVGLFDMLRAELDPNGIYNIPEYGTVKDEAQFKALHAYSPYHNIKENKDYPAMLLTTGANDQRVNPMHSRKMTARLQAANSAGTPVLLRADRSGGHGRGSSIDKRVSDLADVFSFALTYTDTSQSSTDCSSQTDNNQ